MATALDQYPAKKTSANLASYTKCVIADFAIGLCYFVAEEIGDTPNTTITSYLNSQGQAATRVDPVNPTPYYVMRPVLVTAATLVRDLFEFQERILYGQAYKTGGVPITTAAPTTTP